MSALRFGIRKYLPGSLTLAQLYKAIPAKGTVTIFRIAEQDPNIGLRKSISREIISNWGKFDNKTEWRGYYLNYWEAHAASLKLKALMSEAQNER